MKSVTLYKRGVNGEPQFWSCSITSSPIDLIHIEYGAVNGHHQYEEFPSTMTTVEKEFESRVNAKRKAGYRELSEIYDNAPNTLTDIALYAYLKTHLKDNVVNDGIILPMLAKTLETNRPFENYGTLRGQWKINGLRCEIGAIKDSQDMFKEISLTFQSREGTVWHLPYLEEAILPYIDKSILDMMVESGAKLDGEIYYPGLSINDINHLVKNPNDPRHRNLQFWLYDIAVESMRYECRREYLNKSFSKFMPYFTHKEFHLNNKNPLIYLPEYPVSSFDEAVIYRDEFISLGFEGLILRNPKAEYGFGKRSVELMYKFKKVLDGIFQILKVIPEGTKRQDLCKLVLKNDISSDVFECTINASHEEQRQMLLRADEFIGKKVLVEYRERSGVTNVPFHAKAIRIVN